MLSSRKDPKAIDVSSLDPKLMFLLLIIPVVIEQSVLESSDDI